MALMGSYLGDRDLVQFALASPDNDRDFTDLIEGLILMPGQTCNLLAATPSV